MKANTDYNATAPDLGEVLEYGIYLAKRWTNEGACRVIISPYGVLYITPSGEVSYSTRQFFDDEYSVLKKYNKPIVLENSEDEE